MHEFGRVYSIVTFVLAGACCVLLPCCCCFFMVLLGAGRPEDPNGAL